MIEHTPKTVRVGIVGLGMGKAQIGKFNALPQSRIAALCDSDTERLHSVAEQHGIKDLYTNASEMFYSGSIDAVVIATPNFSHHPLTLEALQAGLHVLTEKPMALDAAQAEEMLNTARNKKRILSVHYNHRMSPSAQLIDRYIANGDLGDIYFIRTVWHRRKGIPQGASGWFYREEESGGGCFVDLGVHMIDMALSFAGYPKVRSVNGQLHNKFGEVDVPNQNMDVEDFGTAYIRCENDICIAVEISWASHAASSGMRTEIYGTSGGAIRGGDQLEILKREQGQLANTYFPSGINDQNMPTVQSDFIEAIQENREPRCSAEQGLLLMRILDAVKKSSETGHEISFENT